jgi:AcrR family transcriptional regulator
MMAPHSRQPANATAGKAQPRNATATKQRLLAAAQESFGRHGFNGTTVRGISESAGVDHALIRRYFGSKADLYIAALVDEVRGDQPPVDFAGRKDMVEGMVSRMDSHGLGPVMQALVRTDTEDPVHQAARAHMARRLVEPMVMEMSRRQTDEAPLRAEIVASALIGISLGRALRWFDGLAVVPKDHLVDLVEELLDEASKVRSDPPSRCECPHSMSR